MMAVASVLLIVTVAALVAAPFARGHGTNAEISHADGRAELLEREKNAALIAIREAEFDRAMGKLSEDDYASLKGLYEQRALGALSELERMGNAERSRDVSTAGPKPESAVYCPRCGSRFRSDDRFCSDCGSQRGISSR